MTEAVVLLGCGGPIDEPMQRYSELVRDTLAGADIRFAQIQRTYSEHGKLRAGSGGAHGRLPPSMVSVITDCGFNVASMAGNHAMDWGPEALLDTIELLRGMGIEVIGAGRNLAEARQPAVIDCKGLRIAMQAYCSVLHEGYAAGPDTPGVAPMRVYARYEPVDYQPGVPPRVITTPDEQDLADLVADVRAAKERADTVVLSLHWGVHFVPRVIADYQRLLRRLRSRREPI
jgi:poly-gamma-glutamate capsule biosynthesis protein CapA/YwtB (metallophosphatase superfamily)